MKEEAEKIIKGQFCPYCKCETKLVSGDEVYPHRTNDDPRPKFLDKKYYMCLLNSNHYVGTYSDNITSLGRLADTELRKLKNQGHNTFDPLWKTKNIFQSQKLAYDWLSEKMELPLELTHFGMFTVEQCKRAIEFCKNLDNENV
ncbi:zinc-finger-containing protein [Aequorivita sp. KMM 9714]|uniref:zinc-finger-containing protein n=1 Tax=Aequorivita sp. KMM 9714 TaxID=2707173 RepID=UPI0013ED9C29|nr:zinc-finger-containing protein [Aequorivita sp. KMM 9714]NGX85055.1 hypothetical protein [Aequorivita sp. KMM 9714]